MITAFHKELTDYIRAKDKEKANEVILRELALCLATDKENFIDVLRNAGINADSNESDLNLIELFVNNAPKNKRLLLGAALLVNHRNKVTNFDGDEEISDAGVKNTYGCLRSNFIGKGYSSIGGGWSDAVKSVAELGSKFQQSAHNKKFGASVSLAAQQEGRKAMIGALLDQKKQSAQSSIDKEASAKKSKNTLFIVGGVVATVAIVGLLIYKFKK